MEAAGEILRLHLSKHQQPTSKLCQKDITIVVLVKTHIQVGVIGQPHVQHKI